MFDSRDKFVCEGCNKPKSIDLLVWVRGREYCMWCIQDGGMSIPRARMYV